MVDMKNVAGSSMLAFLITVAVSSSAIAATPVCIERSVALSQLAMEFGETPVALGLANNGAVVELLKSRDGKTWTIVLTMPSGLTCILAAGEGWTQDSKPKPDSAL